jgi:monofunctional glycosyltransferase
MEMKKMLTYLLKISLLFWVTLGLGLSIFLGWLYWSLPSGETIRGCLVTSLYQVDLCPSHKNYVPYKKIPSHFIEILITSEDASFWTHQGFDFFEIQKSLEQNFIEKRYKRGASTLTQQLAKNLFLTQEKTLLRKLREALITVRLEHTLSKKEILERYINVVEFGPRIYGLTQASQFYFEKKPGDLDPEESAFLVMLLPHPKVYSQSFFKKNLTPFAFSRVNTLLKQAWKKGALSLEEFEAAQYRTRFLFDSDFIHWDGLETSTPLLEEEFTFQEEETP